MHLLLLLLLLLSEHCLLPLALALLLLALLLLALLLLALLLLLLLLLPASSPFGCLCSVNRCNCHACTRCSRLQYKLTCDSTTFVALLTAFKPSNNPMGLPSSSLRGLIVSFEPTSNNNCVRCVIVWAGCASAKLLLWPALQRQSWPSSGQRTCCCTCSNGQQARKNEYVATLCHAGFGTDLRRLHGSR
jgi:hypothetical protein